MTESGDAPFNAEERAQVDIVVRELDFNRVFVPYIENYTIAHRIVWMLRERRVANENVGATV